jgi:hypothetical protein
MNKLIITALLLATLGAQSEEIEPKDAVTMVSSERLIQMLYITCKTLVNEKDLDESAVGECMKGTLHTLKASRQELLDWETAKNPDKK